MEFGEHNEYYTMILSAIIQANPSISKGFGEILKPQKKKLTLVSDQLDFYQLAYRKTNCLIKICASERVSESMWPVI